MNPLPLVLEFFAQKGKEVYVLPFLSARDDLLAAALRRRRSPAGVRSRSPELLAHLAGLSVSQWAAAVRPLALPYLAGRSAVDVSPTFPFLLPLANRLRSLALAPWHGGLPAEFARFLIKSRDRIAEPSPPHEVAASLEPLSGLAPGDYAAYLVRLSGLAPRAVLVLPARSRPSRADWRFDPEAWAAALAAASAVPESETVVDSYRVVVLSLTAPKEVTDART